MTEHPLVLHLERIEEGTVRLRIVKEDRPSGSEQLVLDVTVMDDLTATAQREALRQGFDYLRRNIDLSHGGRA